MTKLKNVLASAVCLLLCACSSSPFNKETRVSMDEYVEQLYTTCLNSEKYSDSSEQDKKIICKNHARRSVSVSQNMFEHFQKDNLMKACENEEDFAACAKDYQKVFYDKTMESFAKEML